MTLIDPEKQLLVADTVRSPGFKIILSMLTAHKEELESLIESAKGDEEERRLVNEWRSYRRVVAELEEIKITTETEPALDLLDPFKEDRKEYIQKMLGIFGNMELGEIVDGTE